MNEFIQDVAIIVVFYNPSDKQIQNFENLNKEICVIGVDNSYSEHKVHITNYLPQFKNGGVAAAQNVGIRRAVDLGYKYIIFFDQDSFVSLEFIEKMKKEYISISKTDTRMGLLGPIVVEEATNIEYKNLSNPQEEFCIVSDIISSGMFLSTEVARIIGPLEEGLFIDYVDCEWCWRASDKGILTYMTRNVLLRHTVGSKYFSIFGIHFGISSAFRYYYQYRNVLWLFTRAYTPVKWKRKILCRLLADFFVIPIVSDEHIQVTKNMVHGIIDGLKKKRE